MTIEPTQEARELLERAGAIICRAVSQYEQLETTPDGTVGIWLFLNQWQAVRDALTRPSDIEAIRVEAFEEAAAEIEAMDSVGFCRGEAAAAIRSLPLQDGKEP